MKAEDLCHECKGKANTVFIDGSSYIIGDRASQSSDRAEVRALVAALEKTEDEIYVITDNQYVRDTAQYIASGGNLHKGKHYDLWSRIESHIHKMKNIRWVKAHLKKENAAKAGVNFEDWSGSNEADIQAKEGAATNGYTENESLKSKT
eukprot:2256240-Heterocapsa_arctica.AAC.1